MTRMTRMTRSTSCISSLALASRSWVVLIDNSTFGVSSTGLRQDFHKLSHPGLSSMIFSKPTKNYGKPPFLMDKSTISTGICLKHFETFCRASCFDLFLACSGIRWLSVVLELLRHNPPSITIHHHPSPSITIHHHFPCG